MSNISAALNRANVNYLLVCIAKSCDATTQLPPQRFANHNGIQSSSRTPAYLTKSFPDLTSDFGDHLTLLAALR